MDLLSFSISNGWEEIEDFLATPNVDDCEEERKLAGFSSTASISVGDTEQGKFCVHVFDRVNDTVAIKSPQFQFLVDIDVGGRGYYVVIPKLPDLLELLRQTVPLSVSIDEWSIKKEKYLEKINERIESGYYNKKGP